MATKTYVYGSSAAAIAQNIASALQPLVTAGFFDEITTSATSDTASNVLCKIDGASVVSLTIDGTLYQEAYYYITRASLLLDSGTTLDCMFGDAANLLYFNAAPIYVYTCSGGAYISTGRNSTAAINNSGTFSGVFISKTNNGKIGIFICGALSAYNSGNWNSIAGRLSDTFSWAQDDDASECAKKYAFPTPQLRNQATLMNIPTSNAANNPSYFPDIVLTFTSQTAYVNNNDSPPINFEQDGKKYLWTGYYAIRDEGAP